MKKIKVFAVILCLVVVFPVYAFEQDEKEIVLMGTAHIFDVEGKIREKTLGFKPDAIAVELDENFFNTALNWVKSKQDTSNDISKMTGAGSTNKENLTEACDYAWELFRLHNAIDMLAGITIAQELNIPVYPIAPEEGFVSPFQDLSPFLEQPADQELLTSVFPICEEGFLLLFTNCQLLFKISPKLLVASLRNSVAFLQAHIKILGRIITLMCSEIFSSILARSISNLINITVPYASILLNLILIPILFAIISIIYPLIPSFMTSEGLKIARESAKLFFPRYYSIAYERKEKFMSDKIAQICEDHDKVVVITGLAHMDGLEEEIKEKVPQARIKKISLFELV